MLSTLYLVICAGMVLGPAIAARGPEKQRREAQESLNKVQELLTKEGLNRGQLRVQGWGRRADVQ